MTLTLHATELMTWDEYEAKYRESGFRWHRSDFPVISPATAQLALTALDEKIAGTGVYGDTLTDLVVARDELQTALCHAQDVS